MTNGMEHGAARSAFLPILCIAVALLAALGFQTFRLAQESSSLEAMQVRQAPLVEKSRKLRTSLDAMAAQTQKLADMGNANAQLIVQELRKRGIIIDPNARSASP